MAGALANIGNVLFKQTKAKEALSTYEQALKIHTEVGNALGKANTLTNMGSLYSRMRQEEEALDCLRQAMRIFESVGARTKGLEAAEELIRRITREEKPMAGLATDRADQNATADAEAGDADSAPGD